MAIRKNKFRTYTVYCDECQDFFDTNEDTPREAWLDAKKAGWHQTEIGDFYSFSALLHYCPECWERVQNEG